MLPNPIEPRRVDQWKQQLARSAEAPMAPRPAAAGGDRI
jgi:hypothetical protein